MRLLVVVGDQRDHGFAELVELVLGLRVEDLELGQVDHVARVVRVLEGDGTGAGPLGWDPNIAKEVLGMGKIGILLLLANASATSRVVLILLLAGRLLRLSASLLLLGRDALGLALVGGFGGGGSLGLGLLSLLCFLALYFGIFGGVPGLENLEQTSQRTNGNTPVSDHVHHCHPPHPRNGDGQWGRAMLRWRRSRPLRCL
jgi:hypothetical protein